MRSALRTRSRQPPWRRAAHRLRRVLCCSCSRRRVSAYCAPCAFGALLIVARLPAQRNWLVAGRNAHGLHPRGMDCSQLGLRSGRQICGDQQTPAERRASPATPFSPFRSSPLTSRLTPRASRTYTCTQLDRLDDPRYGPLACWLATSAAGQELCAGRGPAATVEAAMSCPVEAYTPGERAAAAWLTALAPSSWPS